MTLVNTDKSVAMKTNQGTFLAGFGLILRSGLLLLSVCLVLGCEGDDAIENAFGGSGDDAVSDVGDSAFEFSPTSYEFPPTAANSAFSDQTISITNTSIQSVRITGLDGANADFIVQSTSCSIGATMNTGDSCDVVIRFQPQNGGLLSMTLRVNYTLTGSENFQSIMGISGRGVGNLSFTGIDTIDTIGTTSATINWTADINAANYFVFDVSGAIPNLVDTVAAGGSSYTLTGLTPSTGYTFRVRAQDFLGNLDFNTNDISFSTLDPPVLTDLADRVFPNDEGVESTLLVFDVDNTSNGPANDTNMSYVCYWDQVVDGSVATTNDCSTLPGVVVNANLSNLGQLDWTPGSEDLGSFEIRFSGTLDGVTDDEIVVIAVRQNYEQTNLLVDLNSQFADSQAAGTNSPFLGTIANLAGSGSQVGLQVTLSNFAGSTSSGWDGVSGQGGNPNHITFDGANDFLNFGTGLGSESTLFSSFWVRFNDTATGGQVLMNNGGGVGNGFRIRQAVSAPDQLELAVGASSGENHDVDVLADSPVGYWRLGEATAGTTDNLGSIGSAADGTANGTTMNQPALAADPEGNTSALFDGVNDYVVVPNNGAINSAGPYTVKSIEVYFMPTGSVTTKQMVYEQGGSSNGLNIYIDGGSVYCQVWSVSQGWGGSPNTKFVSSPVSLNNTYHVVLTFDQPGDEMTCYVNGVSAGTVNGLGLMNSHSGDISIGRVGDSSYDFNGTLSAGHYFQGVIDEVAIYNSVLTPAQVLNHYNPAEPSCRASTSVSQGLWYNIGMGYDGSSAKLFINGSEACEVSTSSGFQPAADSLTFGALSDGSSAWSGDLSRLKIYSDYPTGDDVNDPLNLFNLERLEHTIQPDQITDMLFWLNPESDITFDGSNRVSSWLDQSGNNYHALQPDTSEAPTYSATSLNGQPGVTFNAGSGHHFPISDLSFGLAGLPSITFVSVVRSTGDGHICSFDRSAVFRFEIDSGAPAFSTTDQSGNIDDYADGTNVQDGQIHIVAVTYDQVTGDKTTYVDGVMTSQDVGAHADGQALGGGAEIPRFGFIGVGSEASTYDGTAGPTEFFDGTMGDLIVYDRALTAAEIDELEAYLILKYSLPY